MMNKEKQWAGYYAPYFSKANKEGVNALDILDKEWCLGRKTAEECVLPHLSENSIVLEIACGIGRVSRFMAPHCKLLYCTDILEEALREVKKNLKDFNNVIFQKTNGYDLRGFNAEYFDCVYSFTSFFHFDFELVVNYFGEIKRVLNPRGIGIIEFKKWIDKKDVIQLLNKIERLGGTKKYEAELDKWRYVSKEMLRVLCDYYDLEVVDDNVTKFTFRKQK
jgi:ubiquinone/menaquinone biosynthesis C-methylase UbiE